MSLWYELFKRTTFQNAAAALGCSWSSLGWFLRDCKLGISTIFSLKDPALPSDTCISPGGECQRMLGGLLHM